jgi:hypothetical protein
MFNEPAYEIINIYDNTCIYCKFKHTVSIDFNKYNSKRFYCNKCNQIFVSHKLLQQYKIPKNTFPKGCAPSEIMYN